MLPTGRSPTRLAGGGWLAVEYAGFRGRCARRRRRPPAKSQPRRATTGPARRRRSDPSGSVCASDARRSRGGPVPAGRGPSARPAFGAETRDEVAQRADSRGHGRRGSGGRPT